MRTDEPLSTYRLNLPGQTGILVTGGGGFLGGAIVRRLREQGLPVTSFSRAHYPGVEALGVKQVQGDLADPEAVRFALRDCSLVLHVAARAGIWGSYRDFYRTNVAGTENVLQACLKEGVDRLVYTSSPSVVFDGRDMEGEDESAPYTERFKAAYPATKAMAEKRVLEANGSQLATVALRPHLVWGPGDTHIIPGLLRRGRKGQLRRLGRADKKVDFTYIDNAAHAHLLAAERLVPGSVISGRPFFVTDDSPVPLWGFINRILKIAGLPPVERSIHPQVAYLAAGLVEAVHRILRLRSEPRLTRFLVEEMSTSHWFNVEAARQDLGYRPLIDLETGMKRVESWLAERGELEAEGQADKITGKARTER